MSGSQSFEPVVVRVSQGVVRRRFLTPERRSLSRFARAGFVCGETCPPAKEFLEHRRLIMRVAMTIIVSLIATSAPAQIIVPTLVSTQNDNTDVAVSASVANLTNGSGLSSPVPSGSTLAAALAATHTFGSTGERESWTTRSSLPSTDYYSASPMPVFVWDLGQDTPLDAIVLWQYGNSGGVLDSDGNAARTFLLRFNTAAEGTSFAGPSEFSGTMTRVWATGGINGAQAFPLGGVTARYVELTVSDNYFGTGGTIGGVIEWASARYGSMRPPSPMRYQPRGASSYRRRKESLRPAHCRRRTLMATHSSSAQSHRHQKER